MTQGYTSKIYFLETDKIHSQASFNIIGYCSLADTNKFTFTTSSPTTDSFPKKGSLTIHINNYYNITESKTMMVTSNNAITAKTEKKLYIVHEDAQGQQYLYYSENYNYSFSGENNSILEITSCFQTTFDHLLSKMAETDFQERTNKVKEFLTNIENEITALRSRQLLNEPKRSQSGGKIPENFVDLNVTDEIENLFRSMIGNYIKAVNEFINLPNLKKVLALNNSELKEIENLKQYIPLLNKFHYVGIDNTQLTEDNHKFFMIGADFKANKRTNIRKILDTPENKTKIEYLTKGIDIPADTEGINTNLNNENKYTDSNKRTYFNINDFANEILENIFLCKEPYFQIETSGSNIADTDRELNKNLAYFFYYILEIIEKEKECIQNILHDTGLLTELNDNEELKSAINKKIQERIDVSILTYLKIRNDQHNRKEYNQRRFNIQLESLSGAGNTTKTMVLDYNDDHTQYYTKDKEGAFNTNSKDIPEYKHKYIFGNFTNIFRPEKSNKEIAGYVNEIIDKLKEENPKPVFVMGYGSSGAGKTSTLISRKISETDREDGILIEICNKLATEKTYDNINVKIIELYKNPNDTDNNDSRIQATNYIGFSKKTTNTNNGYNANFTYNKTNNYFQLKDVITHTNNHPFRVYKQENAETNMLTKKFPVNTRLGDYLTYVIDTDRHVKGTPNNINSSRSHSLVFLNLSNSVNKKNAYLIVGDFAGVENEFNCENNETINDFLSIKKLDGKLFYENEIYNGTKDPIGKIVQNGGGQDEKNIIQEALQGIPFDYGNINTVPTFLNEHISKVNNDVDLLNFKKSVRLVRAMADIQIEQYTGKEKRMLDSKQIASINSIKPEEYIPSWNAYKQQAESKINEVSKNAELIKKNTIEFNAKQELKSLFTGEKWGPDSTGLFVKQEGSIYDNYLNDNYLNDELLTIPVLPNRDPNSKGNITELKSIHAQNSKSQHSNPTIYISPINNSSNGFTVLERCFVEQVSQDTKDWLKAKIAEKMSEEKKYITKENLFFTSEKKDPLQNGLELTTRYEFSLTKYNLYDKALTAEKDKLFILPYIFLILSEKKPTLSGVKPTLSGRESIFNTSDQNIKGIVNTLLSSSKIDQGTNMSIDEISQKLFSQANLTGKSKIMKKSDGIPVDNSPNKKNPFEPFVKKFLPINYNDSTENSNITPDPKLQKLLENEVDNSKIFSFNLSTGTFNSEKKFIDSVLNEDSKLLPYLIELEKYTYEKQDLGKTVCENRRVEGTFINHSLSELRETIREILMIKNKDMLHVVPNYVNICFDKYCPTHKGCFSFKPTVRTNQSTTKQNRLIIQQIQTYFNDKIDGPYHNDNFTDPNEVLYKDLVLCIFCVFNISKGANNPPPVPYVDINELKRIVYNYNLFPVKRDKKDRQIISTFLFYAQQLIDDLKYKYIERYTDGDETRTKNLLESVTTIIVPDETQFQNTGSEKFKKIENFMTTDTTTPLNFTTYYKIFLFILDNLLSGQETLSGRQEMEELINDIQLKLNKTILQSDLNNVLKQNNSQQITDKHNEIMSLFKQYKLYDINMLIHYLQLDYERLVSAKEAITSARNTGEEEKMFKGYDPRIIYDPTLLVNPPSPDKYTFIAFTEEEREDFHNYTGVTSDEFKFAFEGDTEPHKTHRQRVYTAMRLYIQNKIKELYRKIFTRNPDKNMLELVVDQLLENSKKDDTRTNAVENLSIIKTYIDQQISYYEHDVYDDEKIAQLDNMIEVYKSAQSALTSIQDMINIQIQKLQKDAQDINNITFSNVTPKIVALQQELKVLTDDKSSEAKHNRQDIITNKQHNNRLFQQNSDKYMKFLEEFLRIIDNNNDASSVGTLEFLDKIAKLNTVSTICNFETQKLNEASDNFNNKLKLELQPLY